MPLEWLAVLSITAAIPNGACLKERPDELTPLVLPKAPVIHTDGKSPTFSNASLTKALTRHPFTKRKLGQRIAYFSYKMPPQKVLALYRLIHKQRQQLELRPVIVAAERESTYDLDSYLRIEQELAKLRAFDAHRFLQAREKRLAAESTISKKTDEKLRRGLAALDASMPRDTSTHPIQLDFEKRNNPVQLVLMHAAAHELPIHLGFGGWNECPMPHAQAGVLKMWMRTYKARLIYIGHDTLELVVDRPPTTLASLKKLAWQQYQFCRDIVEQGANTVVKLAQALLLRTWYFWWD